MEDDKTGPKYAKLLAEYTKLRTQAKVLKNAVVEERNKVSVLQESLRIKDQNLRRVETEFDSVNFRNKQLEHRVASLQDDLQVSERSSKGSSNASKINNKTRSDNQAAGNGAIDPILAEELQKKIIESATLASTISDKNNEIEMYVNRIKDLELQVSKQMNNHNEIEKKLRKEIEVLSIKNTELETKIIEATSQLGSEGDSTSLASDSTLPINNVMPSSSSSAAASNHTDDRIAFLEKELNHYRTQYELLKINDALRMDEHLMVTAAQQSNQLQHNYNNNNNNNSNQTTRKVLSSQSSTSSSMSNNNNNNHSTFVNYPTSSQSSGSKSSPSQNSKSLPDPSSSSSKCGGGGGGGDGDDGQSNETINRDQVVYDYFSKRFEQLFQEKCKAESKVLNYITECESLKSNIELLMEDNEEKERKQQELQASYVRLEEDFVTTRVNYEEQICVLTDQVINLSDQLATR